MIFFRAFIFVSDVSDVIANANLQRIYDSHNEERSKIGVSPIIRDEELEKVINADACRSTELSRDFPRYACTRCDYYEMGGQGMSSRTKLSSQKFDFLGLTSWIEEKQFLEGGKCDDQKKCGHYKLAFQTGKRVGCSFNENCPGPNKMVAKCFYCSGAFRLQDTISLYIFSFISLLMKVMV